MISGPLVQSRVFRKRALYTKVPISQGMCDSTRTVMV